MGRREYFSLLAFTRMICRRIAASLMTASEVPRFRAVKDLRYVVEREIKHLLEAWSIPRRGVKQSKA